jgi:hypothetical protein
MQNEGRYIPLETRHLLEDGARRRGTSYEREKYLWETSELEQLVDAARAEDAARSAAEAAITKAEAEAAVAKVDFVAEHCENMFAAAINSRSNCIKFRLFSVFQAACERIALYDDDEYSASNKLCKLVARAENWLLDEPDPERFHQAVVYAFQRSGFKDFPELADALKMEIEMDDIRRLALRLAPRRQVLLDDETAALMKKRCPMRRARR